MRADHRTVDQHKRDSTSPSTRESIASRASSSSSVPGRASSVPSGSTGRRVRSSTSAGAEVDRAIGLDVVALGDRLRGVAEVRGGRVDARCPRASTVAPVRRYQRGLIPESPVRPAPGTPGRCAGSCTGSAGRPGGWRRWSASAPRAAPRDPAPDHPGGESGTGTRRDRRVGLRAVLSQGAAALAGGRRCRGRGRPCPGSPSEMSQGRSASTSPGRIAVPSSTSMMSRDLAVGLGARHTGPGAPGAAAFRIAAICSSVSAWTGSSASCSGEVPSTGLRGDGVVPQREAEEHG